LPSMSILTLL